VSESRKNAPPGRVDGRQVELDAPAEVAYWVKYFDTTRDELFAAVSATGTLAGNVAVYLAAKKAGQAPR